MLLIFYCRVNAGGKSGLLWFNRIYVEKIWDFYTSDVFILLDLSCDFQNCQLFFPSSKTNDFSDSCRCIHLDKPNVCFLEHKCQLVFLWSYLTIFWWKTALLTLLNQKNTCKSFHFRKKTPFVYDFDIYTELLDLVCMSLKLATKFHCILCKWLFYRNKWNL